MYEGKDILFWSVVSVCCVFFCSGVSYTIEILPGIGREDNLSTVQDFYSVASSKIITFILTFVIPYLIFPIFAGFLIDLSLGLRLVT